MYVAGKWNWSFSDDGTHDYGDNACGYSRCCLVGREIGAVHTELGLVRVEPGGRLDRHVHSFEQCAYVMGGDPVVEVGTQSYRLRKGDYVMFPVAMPHSWHNPGAGEARWMEFSTPQQLSPESGRRDTYFLPPAEPAAAVVPNFTSPTVRYVGHYLGSPPQYGAQVERGSERDRQPAGMDTALLAYSGISIKMLVDGNFGAELLTLFTVDYEPGGAAQLHDHPFEEAYFFLDGEIEAEVDGEKTSFRGGEFLFCGVGVLHGFFNTSSGRVRWLETQAPQPPRRHSYRWPACWEQLGAELADTPRTA